MNYSENKIGIVVQGASLYVNEIKNAWEPFKNDLIFSTWKGSEKEYSDDDIVIFNDPPNSAGPYNFNYQKKSTYNGLLKAKELGYTHVLKIRSDNIPTNSIEFIKLFDINKLNFLTWHYTSFLWLSHPTLNGYFDDHISFGPIDSMIKLWDITDVFVFSPEIILTWNYISKLKNIIDVNYILKYLNSENDLYYIKFNNISPNNSYAHNILNNNFGSELYGRYESIFQSSKEHLKDAKDSSKFINDKYLNFLKYFKPLPKITIFGNYKNEIIYPENKLEIVNDINHITGDYVIKSNDILNPATLIIEYFKKKNMLYINTTTSSYELNESSCLLTIDDFLKQFENYD